MKVSLALALPLVQVVVELELAEGATVAEAVAAADLAARFPGIELDPLTPGIWSRACAWDTRLREGDRVELYRPLQADAKGMRRARAGRRRQGP